MRFNDRVTFVFYSRDYDYDIGNWNDKDLTRYVVPCFVMSLGLDEQVKIFGDFKRDRLVAFLKNRFDKKYTRVVFKGATYKVVFVRNGAYYLESDVSTVGDY